MSKLGFDIVLKKLPTVEKRFLREGMKMAQKEFDKNFRTESNTETGTGWDMVLRAYPPPILDVTGKLRGEAVSSKNVTYYADKAVLVIDPIDERGRGYASYHMTGTDRMVARKYVTQSAFLDYQQKNLLSDLVHKAFD